jgi:hypothetical protein
MVTHRSLSNRTFPGMCAVFVLAAMLASCRGAGEPAAGTKPAADTAAPAPAPPAPPPPPARELTWSRKVDMKLWSPAG